MFCCISQRQSGGISLDQIVALAEDATSSESALMKIHNSDKVMRMEEFGDFVG